MGSPGTSGWRVVDIVFFLPLLLCFLQSIIPRICEWRGPFKGEKGFHFEAYTWQMAFHAFLHVASGFFTCLIVGVKWLSTWLLGWRCKKTDPPHFLVNDRMT